jgi:hypothetical protein
MAAVLLAAGGAEAGPFAVQADGTGAAWVLDETSGALRVCRTVTTTGPKVLDVFGGGADLRPGMERAARTDCTVAMAAVEDVAAVPVRGMLGDGSSGPQVGSGAGMLGYGLGGWPRPGGWDRQVVIVRPGSAVVNLY